MANMNEEKFFQELAFKVLQQPWCKKRTPLNSKINNLKVGENLFLSIHEWNLKSHPHNRISAACFKPRSTLFDRRFKVKSVFDSTGKIGWNIYRKK